MKPETLDRTIQVIEELSQENQVLQEKLAHYEKVLELTNEMLNMGSIAPEDFKGVYKKLLDNSREELVVFEKAASLIREGNFFNLGTLSDRPQHQYHDNPLIACLFED